MVASVFSEQLQIHSSQTVVVDYQLSFIIKGLDEELLGPLLLQYIRRTFQTLLGFVY